MEWIVTSTPIELGSPRLHMTPRNDHLQGGPSSTADNLNPTPADVYIFNSPADLMCFAEQIGHAEISSGGLEFAPSADRTLQRLTLRSVRKLRFGLLRSITQATALTETDLNGGLDGPFMTQLISSWREAVRALNRSVAAIRSTDTDSPGLQHGCGHLWAPELVQFDVWNVRDIPPRHIVRVIQEWSTTMHIHAKRGAEAIIEFHVVGCNEESQEWLNNAMPRV
ncbi:uncharacterized protein FPRN_03745 [Fusarium proliferatum]|nr:uncharacterized protein FPRN_03745 [Fusarium proliferatum]